MHSRVRACRYVYYRPGSHSANACILLYLYECTQEQADRPDLVYVGLVSQCDPDDEKESFSHHLRHSLRSFSCPLPPFLSVCMCVLISTHPSGAYVILGSLDRSAGIGQKQEKETSCYLHGMYGLSSHVREIRLHWSEARGPCWARYLAQKMHIREK